MGDDGADDGGLDGEDGSDDKEVAELELRRKLEQSQEFVPAVDIELPSDDTPWDDADLERLVVAMDEHYGDVPVPMSALEAELLDADDGLLFPLVEEDTCEVEE